MTEGQGSSRRHNTEVYKTTTSGENLAIKIISKKNKRCSEVEWIQILLEEVNILHRAQGSGVVKLYDLHEDPERLFLVMELCPEDLYTACISGKLSEVERKQACIEITHTVRRLHGLEIIHRDLKPDNIMRGIDGAWKLIDFGSSMDLRGIGGDETRS